MASGMRKVVIDDFSGGIATGGSFSSLTQVAKADGFLIQDGKRVRSQWEIIGIDAPNMSALNPPLTAGAQLVAAVPAFGGFLLVFSTGEIVLWNKFGSGALTRVEFLSVDPVDAAQPKSSKYKEAITSFRFLGLGGGTFNESLYCRINRRMAVIEFRGAYVVELTPGGLPSREPVQPLRCTFGFRPYVEMTTATQTVAAEPKNGTLIVSQVVTMWNQNLILANIGDDYAPLWNGVNRAAFPQPNYFYVMDAVDPTKPASQFPVGGFAKQTDTIVGMIQVDEGMLCFVRSTVEFGEGGVYLLRGTAEDYVGSSIAGQVEKISDICIGGVDFKDDVFLQNAINQEIGDASLIPYTYWDALQSVVFVSIDGHLYQYRQGRVADITPPFLLEADLNNATSEGTRRISLSGCVAAQGQSLLFFHEATKSCYALRAQGETGAWTKMLGLNLSGPTQFVNSSAGIMVIANSKMPSAADNVVSRMFVSWPSAQYKGVSGRGKKMGLPLMLRLATAPVGFDSPHLEKWWHQVGVRVRCAPGNPDGGKVVAITTRGELADGQTAEHREVLPAQLASLPGSGLFEYVVPAYGYGPTCQVELECQGDVIVDSITVWWQPGTDRW